jgi:hypothetical protein
MKNKICDRLAKLFAMLGSDNAGERENAQTPTRVNGHNGHNLT